MALKDLVLSQIRAIERPEFHEFHGSISDLLLKGTDPFDYYRLSDEERIEARANILNLQDAQRDVAGIILSTLMASGSIPNFSENEFEVYIDPATGRKGPYSFNNEGQEYEFLVSNALTRNLRKTFPSWELPERRSTLESIPIFIECYKRNRGNPLLVFRKNRKSDPRLATKLSRYIVESVSEIQSTVYSTSRSGFFPLYALHYALTHMDEFNDLIDGGIHRLSTVALSSGLDMNDDFMRLFVSYMGTSLPSAEFAKLIRAPLGINDASGITDKQKFMHPRIPKLMKSFSAELTEQEKSLLMTIAIRDSMKICDNVGYTFVFENKELLDLFDLSLRATLKKMNYRLTNIDDYFTKPKSDRDYRAKHYDICLDSGPSAEFEIFQKSRLEIKLETVDQFHKSFFDPELNRIKYMLDQRLDSKKSQLKYSSRLIAFGLSTEEKTRRFLNLVA